MNEKNLYEMSDEELMSMDPSELAAMDGGEANTDPDPEDPPETPPANEPADVSGSDEPADQAAAGEAQAADDSDGEGADGDGANDEDQQTDTGADDPHGEGAGDDSQAAADTDPQGDEPPAGDVAAAADKGDADPVDYKAMYERIVGQPIRANGKEMVLESVDDAITLIQMGANYNKKMAALKPNLRLLKMLENNGLLDESKISFLIDLDKKNPEAVKKLIKESGVDPLDVDQGNGEYKPGTYTVADRELELDEVLDRIQDTPTFSKTVDIVRNKWDGPSKQIVAQNPELLEVINDHIARGVFDIISNRVERERVLGRLNGLSDLAAYKKVGDELEASGGFAHLVAQPQTNTQLPPRREVTRKTKDADSERDSKRRAASPTKTVVTASAPAEDFNPLNMSDEDFAKQHNPRLL